MKDYPIRAREVIALKAKCDQCSETITALPNGRLECPDCDRVAVAYLGDEEAEWMARVAYEAAWDRLQDEIDAAFDHQYFNEW